MTFGRSAMDRDLLSDRTDGTRGPESPLAEAMLQWKLPAIPLEPWPMIRLTDAVWERIRKHFPDEHVPDGHPGRKPVPARAVLEAVLWLLGTGLPGKWLPQCYPNHQTAHRIFEEWSRNEVLRDILAGLARELRAPGATSSGEYVVDGRFLPQRLAG